MTRSRFEVAYVIAVGIADISGGFGWREGNRIQGGSGGDEIPERPADRKHDHAGCDREADQKLFPGDVDWFHCGLLFCK